MIIIGGGIAGLVAAFELSRQGHEPLVLEAQHRVGGRVHTIRDFAPGLYAEAGAMRIPRVHDLTLAYCDLFGLQLRPFVMGNPKTLVYIDGQRMTIAEADANPDQLPFDLADHEKGKTWTQLWNEATAASSASATSRGARARSTRCCASTTSTPSASSCEMRGFSEGAIELYGVMSFRESNMNAAVVEQLREIVGRAFEDMQEIVGGMDLLPRAFYEQLKPHVRFGAEVTAIEQDARRRSRVHYRTGRRAASASRGDYAICTIPFSVLRDIEILTTPSPGEKQKAIRELNYNASTKILFQVRAASGSATDGIVGGTTVTDLPIRRICYPSLSDPGDERGTLLAVVHLGAGRAALGRDGRRDADRAGARGRRPDPPRDHDRVRGRRHPRLVRRPLRARGLRAVRARAADATCRTRSSRPRAASTSPASTPPCTTPGSRAPWSRPARGPRRPRGSLISPRTARAVHQAA